MTPRQRVRAVLAREPVDRLPIDLWYTDEIGQQLRAHYHATDEQALHRLMGIDKIVWIPICEPKHGSASKASAFDANAEHKTMWGVTLKPQQAGDAQYMEMADSPLAACTSVADLDAYTGWPDPASYDYAEMERIARQASAEFATMGPWAAFFEVYCQMRGLEQAMMDLAVEPEFVQAALDRIEAIQTEILRRFYDRAGGCVDLAFFSDDLGSQSGLLISPAMWDTFLKDRLTRWCRLAHDYGLKVLYHSDGAIEPLIPRLIDAGVDVLNPIQHACPGMDRARLKDRYGDRLIFHGGIENQKVLPFGTPAEVRAEVAACLATLGRGKSGYVVCSCHNIQPGTSLENVLALVEAALNG